DHGHSNLSLADSSFDLWLDGYKAGIPDRKVSIYQKGALAALILDLTIRQLTQNQKNLDDVMRQLWLQFKENGKGYTAQDYQHAAETVAGTSLQNYFKTGYVAEGVTTYYGDYLLARSGVFNWPQYQKELNQYLQKHFADHGHSNLSLADSSFDLWLDGYKAGIPDRKVSIYQKGALAALILDLKIRQLTQNQKSLDDVMRQLWQQFKENGKGYTAQDYQHTAETVAGTSLQNYFDEVINGTAPLEPWLEEALQTVGCTLQTEENVAVSENNFGFKTITKDGKLLISAVAPASPAADALSLEDEIVAVNGRKAELSLQHLLEPDKPQEITFFRNHRLRTAQLRPKTNRFYQNYQVQKLQQASAQQKHNFEQWLKQAF
ncbi:MAG: hypothetical protein LPJ89_02990, partial [Hymenobacteraceae bacterium]|nr:hypothetical protein [Hymenobacteraceae bacterium]